VAESELAHGRLPNFARLLATGGATRAVSAFPSTTSVAYLPLLTGCLPGRCNVPSIRWLDRQAYQGRWWRDREAVRSYCGYQAGRLDADIDPGVKTIFELVPASAAFFTPITRGLTPDRDPTQGARKFWGALSHYLLWHQPGDDAAAAGLLDWIDRDPEWRFLFAQFPAVDGYTHQTTPNADRVVESLRRLDRTIGQLAERLAARGLATETLIVVVSDHGATRVDRHLDLAEWFRQRGVPTLAHPEVWRPNPQAAVMVAGNGSAMVYAAPNTARASRWSLARLRHPEAFGAGRDMVADLVRAPGVAFVAAEDEPGVVRLADRRGEALLRQRPEGIEYAFESGDPLGIGGGHPVDRPTRYSSDRPEPVVETRRGWLARTFDGPFPDGPVQLLDQFRATRTGDLVVVAERGTDFRDRWEIPEHKSGHGSLIREHMQVPLWSNRPLGTIPIRTADLFVSILGWLGTPVPEGIDGEEVWRVA